MFEKLKTSPLHTFFFSFIVLVVMTSLAYGPQHIGSRMYFFTVIIDLMLAQMPAYLVAMWKEKQEDLAKKGVRNFTTREM